MGNHIEITIGALQYSYYHTFSRTYICDEIGEGILDFHGLLDETAVRAVVYAYNHGWKLGRQDASRQMVRTIRNALEASGLRGVN